MSKRSEIPQPHIDRSNDLVADPVVAEEFNISLMGLWRWSKDKDLGFPPAVKIRNRNYRQRRALDEFKARMISRGMAA